MAVPEYMRLSQQEKNTFLKGESSNLYHKMGGRLCASNFNSSGAFFNVWAPHVKNASVVGDFNNWDPEKSPMAKETGGVWSVFIPEAKAGMRYKFAFQTEKGLLLKSDPYGLGSEKRPQNASVLVSLEGFEWTDQAWIDKRDKAGKSLNCPINIYELHLGSWKLGEGGGYLNYRDIGKELGAYCQKMGFTHVEILPLNEHPLDQSWGYQVTGFFSITSRYGTLNDFRAFVNTLHEMGIGVIIDWVPSHFPTDDFALSHFDGTPLYEHRDENRRHQPLWNTLMFDYEKPEVLGFLINSALFWCDVMHIDGLRVDSVAAVLYSDFAEKGSDSVIESPEGIGFIKKLNRAIQDNFPSVLMIAEDASQFAGVTKPLSEGGLGFDLKWNLGWIRDTTDYFEKTFDQRGAYHEKLTFGLMYAFNERFALSLSHDEVSSERGSLWEKIHSRDPKEKLDHLRLLYSYLITYPGKKLFFMGFEIGDMNPWNGSESINWDLLQKKEHSDLSLMIEKLNAFYIKHSALWERDFDWSGFEWIDSSSRDRNLIVYKRMSTSEMLICIHNFSENDQEISWDCLTPCDKPLTSADIVFSTDYDQLEKRSPFLENETRCDLIVPAISSLILKCP